MYHFTFPLGKHSFNFSTTSSQWGGALRACTLHVMVGSAGLQRPQAQGLHSPSLGVVQGSLYFITHEQTLEGSLQARAQKAQLPGRFSFVSSLYLSRQERV